jgi:hypothetical protein
MNEIPKDTRAMLDPVCRQAGWRSNDKLNT